MLLQAAAGADQPALSVNAFSGACPIANLCHERDCHHCVTTTTSYTKISPSSKTVRYSPMRTASAPTTPNGPGRSSTKQWIDEASNRMAQLEVLWDGLSPHLAVGEHRRTAPSTPNTKPQKVFAMSTPRRSTRSTLIPIDEETLIGLQLKSKAKEKEDKRALVNELNRKRMQEHHRNLKTMKSRLSEASPLRAQKPKEQGDPDDKHSPSWQSSPITALPNGTPARVSQEQKSIEFQMVRRSLKKQLNTTDRELNIEFVLPKSMQGQEEPATQPLLPEPTVPKKAEILKEIELTRKLCADRMGQKLNQAATRIRAGDSDSDILAQFGEQHDLRSVKHLLYLEDAYYG